VAWGERTGDLGSRSRNSELLAQKQILGDQCRTGREEQPQKDAQFRILQFAEFVQDHRVMPVGQPESFE